MKTAIKLFRVIALAAIIGFAFIACDDGSGGGGNESGVEGTGGGGDGTGGDGLTITNIPGTVTGYVTGTAVYGSPPLNLVANDGSTLSKSNMKAAAIANGKATLNAFDAGKTYPLPKFTGTASYNSVDVAATPPGNAFMIFVYAVEEPYTSSGFGYQKSEVVGTAATYQLKADKTVQFTNGKATLNWDDLEVQGTGGDDGGGDTVINIQAIAGVTKPVQGATPVTAITANDQYTGTVTWNHSPVTFDYATEYVATITLAAKNGYTLLGVSANFFTVAGADLVTNAANSGVVTATFPQTADDPSLLHLAGDVTISPDTNVTTGTELTAEYTGTEDITITSWQWEKDGVDVGTNSDKYTPTEEGTYTVTLSAEGYNPITSDPVIVTFPTFTTAAAMSTYLDSQPANTADTPYNIKLNVATNPWTTSGAATTAFNGKYVNLDLSGSTFTTFNYLSFQNCTSLVSVTIPASVTAIPNTVTTGGTFRGCTNLTSVTFAEGSQLTNIGDRAFQGCTSLTDITIPESVTTIGASAFSGCTSLTSITIPASVTSISASTFSGCTGLTSVTIPEGVTSIGGGAFYNCTNLTSVTFAGTIASGSFSNDYLSPVFPGDLRAKFYTGDSDNGVPGTYIVTSGTGNNKVWTKTLS